jgi:drug/metabolite transporter (DMT)-like permease
MIAPRSVLAWVMLTGLVLVAPALLVVGPPGSLEGSELGWLAVSGGGNVVGLLLAYSALRIGKVGVVAPILSTEGALAAVLAVVAGEHLGALTGWLLALIAVGICLAAAAPEPTTGRAREPRRRPIILAMLAAVAFGASLYATGHVSATLAIPWVLLPARLIGLLVIMLPLVLRGRLELTRASAPLVVAAGICEVLGFASFAVGARHGIAVSAVLASQFAVLSAVAAYLLFHERLTRLQVSGVTVVVVGVAALSIVGS